MSLRPSQLALRLDAPAPSPTLRWQNGMPVAFLGRCLTLCLDTDVEAAACVGTELHLPLPPQATARQIQDSAEAWLRREAEQHFAAVIGRRSQAGGYPAPRLQLSFATRAGWTEVEVAGRARAGRIKCNWRLIEQAPELIEQVLSAALSATQARIATPDLFGTLAA